MSTPPKSKPLKKSSKKAKTSTKAVDELKDLKKAVDELKGDLKILFHSSSQARNEIIKWANSYGYPNVDIGYVERCRDLVKRYVLQNS